MPYKDLSGVSEGAASGEILKRVMGARKVQEGRLTRTKIFTNARMTSRHIKQFCVMDSESSSLMERAMERFGLSARAHARILKIARTVADLEASPDIRPSHVAEAIQYRTLDRKMLR